MYRARTTLECECLRIVQNRGAWKKPVFAVARAELSNPVLVYTYLYVCRSREYEEYANASLFSDIKAFIS